MKWMRSLVAVFQTVGELFASLWGLKRLWLAPLVLVLVAVGLLLLFATASGIAPFIYTLF